METIIITEETQRKGLTGFLIFGCIGMYSLGFAFWNTFELTPKIIFILIGLFFLIGAWYIYPKKEEKRKIFK